MTISFRLMLIAVALLCFDQHKASAADTNSVTQAAFKRADELVGLWRDGKWEQAASFVIVFTGKGDSATRKQMGITKDATKEEMTKKAAAWFKSLYEKVRPGHIVDVHIYPKDQNLALVEYFQEDIDGFHMRLVDGKWYYSLE